jgi:hypothetical protein
MEQEGWITLAEAAKALDCSIDTIRRKLKRGQIEGQLKTTRHGKIWLVSIGSLSTALQDEHKQPMHNGQGSTQPAQASEPEEELGLLELVRLVTQLQDENFKLNQEVVNRTEAASLWQGRAEMLSHQLSSAQLQLGEAQSTIKMLEAPKIEVKEAENGHDPRSWWKGVLRRFTIS